MKSLLIIATGIFLLLITSCGTNKNISVEGIDGPYVLLNGQMLVVTMTLKNTPHKADAKYKLPHFQNAYLELSSSNNKELVLSYKFNIMELVEFDDGKLPLINLPDERGLPGIVGGSMPGIDFSIDGFEYATLYLSSNHIGFFIPMKEYSRYQDITSFDFFVNNNKGGTITLIGKEEKNHIPGILLLLDFNQDVRDDLLTFISSK